MSRLVNITPIPDILEREREEQERCAAIRAWCDEPLYSDHWCLWPVVITFATMVWLLFPATAALNALAGDLDTRELPKYVQVPWIVGHLACGAWSGLWLAVASPIAWMWRDAGVTAPGPWRALRCACTLPSFLVYLLAMLLWWTGPLRLTAWLARLLWRLAAALGRACYAAIVNAGLRAQARTLGERAATPIPCTGSDHADAERLPVPHEAAR